MAISLVHFYHIAAKFVNHTLRENYHRSSLRKINMAAAALNKRLDSSFSSFVLTRELYLYAINWTVLLRNWNDYYITMRQSELTKNSFISRQSLLFFNSYLGRREFRMGYCRSLLKSSSDRALRKLSGCQLPWIKQSDISKKNVNFMTFDRKGVFWENRAEHN